MAWQVQARRVPGQLVKVLLVVRHINSIPGDQLQVTVHAPWPWRCKRLMMMRIQAGQDTGELEFRRSFPSHQGCIAAMQGRQREPLLSFS